MEDLDKLQEENILLKKMHYDLRWKIIQIIRKMMLPTDNGYVFCTRDIKREVVDSRGPVKGCEYQTIYYKRGEKYRYENHYADVSIYSNDPNQNNRSYSFNLFKNSYDSYYLLDYFTSVQEFRNIKIDKILYE